MRQWLSFCAINTCLLIIRISIMGIESAKLAWHIWPIHRENKLEFSFKIYISMVYKLRNLYTRQLCSVFESFKKQSFVEISISLLHFQITTAQIQFLWHCILCVYVWMTVAEEKLQASIRCLARHGRFLEISKYDLAHTEVQVQVTASFELDRLIGGPHWLILVIRNILEHAQPGAAA